VQRSDFYFIFILFFKFLLLPRWTLARPLGSLQPHQFAKCWTRQSMTCHIFFCDKIITSTIAHSALILCAAAALAVVWACRWDWPANDTNVTVALVSSQLCVDVLYKPVTRIIKYSLLLRLSSFQDVSPRLPQTMEKYALLLWAPVNTAQIHGLMTTMWLLEITSFSSFQVVRPSLLADRD
jgi:hypothetical protein